MSQSNLMILSLFCIWNIFVFFLYGLDKRRARKGKWRISEKALILSAFFMGGLGAALGMRLFHHKTKQRKFQILIPIALLLNILLIGILLYLEFSKIELKCLA